MSELILSRPELGATEEGTPMWELAYLFPLQGQWSEGEYLFLDGLVEFDAGYLEVLPVPTRAHQRIVLFLYRLLWSFIEVSSVGGEVLVAPVPVRLWEEKYREPDIVYLSAARARQTDADYPEGADLVMEVVSGGPNDRYRDLVQKREEYARAGIAEYWIVEPDKQQVTVLQLRGEKYVVHGEFLHGERATSALLDGFAADVAEVFAAAAQVNEDTEMSE